MSTPEAPLRTNWFDAGGAGYAQFRPEYPPELAAFLASIAPDRACAVDVGCGTGQLACQLAEHFDRVAGLDPSVDQLAHTLPHERIRYQAAPAEAMPLPDASASLITAAQAAHWFDLPRFYAQVRRVAAPGAVLALVSYGVMVMEPALRPRFARFYADEIGPYWPPERTLVDSGYADIDFPFPELQAPPMAIRLQWDLPQLLGYVSTWSAARRAREAGQAQHLIAFADDMAELWGDPATPRAVSWPIRLRLGTV